MRYLVLLAVLATVCLLLATTVKSENDNVAGLKALLDVDAGVKAHENQSQRQARQFEGLFRGFGGGRRGFGRRGFGGGGRRGFRRGGFGRRGFGRGGFFG